MTTNEQGFVRCDGAWRFYRHIPKSEVSATNVEIVPEREIQCGLVFGHKSKHRSIQSGIYYEWSDLAVWILEGDSSKISALAHIATHAWMEKHE